MPVEWRDTFHEWTQYYRVEDDGTVVTASHHDAQDVVDWTREMNNLGAGSSPSGDLKLSASIPLGLWLKWKQEEGVDICQPGTDEFLKRKLNDPEYAYLRVWKGQL